LLTSTLVPGINYFVVITHPLHLLTSTLILQHLLTSTLVPVIDYFIVVTRPLGSEVGRGVVAVGTLVVMY